MIPTRVQNLDEARARLGALADFYVSFLTKSDPLADDAAEAFEALPHGEGRRLLDLALTRGIDRVPQAPAALVALFERVDTPPRWVDRSILALGARTYQRTGPAGPMVLSALSLMNGYHSAAATKALVLTGQLDRMARRRLAETGRFVAETCQVGGLERFAPGFATTLRVRLVHAHVRRMLERSGRWDTPAWGTPINQADMAATNLSFSVAVLYGVRMLGFRFSREEADALIQLWRYSGWLSGIDAGLLCASEVSAMELAEVIDLLQSGPDEGSVRLAQALRNTNLERGETGVQRLIAPLVLRWHDAITRATAGDDKADALGVPPVRWRAFMAFSRAIVTPIERAREVLPGATWLASLAGNRIIRTTVDLELKGREPDFRPPAAIPSAA